MKYLQLIPILLILVYGAGCVESGCPDINATNFQFENPSPEELDDCEYSPISFYYSKDTIKVGSSHNYVIDSMILRINNNSIDAFSEVVVNKSKDTLICGLPDFSITPSNPDMIREWIWTVKVRLSATDTPQTLILQNFRTGKIKPYFKCQLIDVLY